MTSPANSTAARSAATLSIIDTEDMLADARALGHALWLAVQAGAAGEDREALSAISTRLSDVLVTVGERLSEFRAEHMGVEQ